MNAKAKHLEVFVNRKKVEVDREHMTGAEMLQAAGFEGDEWDLLQLKGEGDPSGGTLVGQDEELDLKNGEHFRVIPGNRTFGHIRDERR